MAETGFSSGILNPARGAVLDLSAVKKALIISDLHMGCGNRDDLAPNGKLLAEMLEYYYYPAGWHLILNGDVEELQRYSLKKIREQWPNLYRIFDLFTGENRLTKTLGNHDGDLVFEKNYPYPLYDVLRINTAQLPIYVYHGHQSSRVYTNYNNVVRSLLRYVLTPFGIRNISSARSPHRRFFAERQAYNFSRRHNCISVIGHTHRALFESLGRFDFIKFEIERLCRDYPASREKEIIAKEVETLLTELGKLKRSERRDVLRQSLYGDELSVPCLFNSGSAISRRGINALELDTESIALVYWFTEGMERKFVSRGNYEVEKLKGTRRRRAVLNQDKLDYIKARIELLGNLPAKTE
ncbi:MAG: serine/threonine protein phosphatase [Treponema sp.]|jgi:predicted phosphodiesterase|nr:serine/threonine protein phosphatase [Treponema sp.]